MAALLSTPCYACMHKEAQATEDKARQQCAAHQEPPQADMQACACEACCYHQRRMDWRIRQAQRSCSQIRAGLTRLREGGSREREEGESGTRQAAAPDEVMKGLAAWFQPCTRVYKWLHMRAEQSSGQPCKLRCSLGHTGKAAAEDAVALSA